MAIFTTCLFLAAFGLALFALIDTVIHALPQIRSALGGRSASGLPASRERAALRCREAGPVPSAWRVAA